MTDELLCSYCSFCSLDKVLFIKHQFEAHCYEGSFLFTCKFANCRHTFKSASTFATFLSHCYRKHPNWRDNIEITPNIDVNPVEPLETNYDNLSALDTVSVPNATTPLLTSQQHAHVSTFGVVPTDCEYQESLQLKTAKFLITLKEKYRLSQASINFLMESVNDIVRVTSEEIESNVQGVLHNSGYHVPSECFVTVDPFNNLKTEYQQTRFYREYLGLIVSSLMHKSLLLE